MIAPASPRRAAGRRLFVATVASLALHSLLLHGLTRLQLGDITPSPLGEQRTSPRPRRPQRRADFTLRVPKQTAARQPAYEKPLDLPTPSPQPTRQPSLPQSSPRQLPRPAPDQPRQLVKTPPTRRAERSSQPAREADPLDRREAAAPAANPMPTPPVAPLPAATLTSLPPSRQPLPAPLPTREPPPEKTFVGRWQPREAMLLEQLAAGPPPPPDRGEPVLRRPAPVRVPRASGEAGFAVVTPAQTDTTAAPLPDQPPAGQPQPRSLPLPRPRLGRSRLAAAAGSTSGGATRAASQAAAATVGTAAGNGPSGGRSAMRPQPAENLPGRAAGPASNAKTPLRSGISRRGDLLAKAAADTDTAAAGIPGQTAGPAPAEAAGGLTLSSAGPAAAGLSRLVALAGRGRSTAAAVGGMLGGKPAAAVEGGEGLSISAEQFRRNRRSTDMAADRQRSAGPSLERIAAAALPADGRVRDVAEAFAGRLADRRMAAATAKVADREALARADAMIERGLEFLARSQQADGRWSLGSYAGSTPADAPRLTCDTAATGLALLSFLGAGHDHFAGPYRDVVRRGIEWLLAVQQPNGDLYLQADPLSNSCGWMYSHAIATMALCEAVGMTGDPLVRPAADKACRFISASQHPVSGGWRYVPGTDSDLSVSGWMLVALRAGALAGVPVAPETLSGVRKLVQQSASPVDPARYAYNPQDSQQRRSPLSARCMTAVGALMRLHTGVRPGDQLVSQPADLLVADSPSYGSAASRRRDAYLWYYASQVLVHTGGDPWDRWYRDLVDLLAAHQQRKGPAAGSWDPLGSQPDRWGHYGGRIYVTALHLLSLEVPARHLPTYSAADAEP